MSAHDTCPACGKHEAHASKVFDLLDEAKRTERERIIALLLEVGYPLPPSEQRLRAFFEPKG